MFMLVCEMCGLFHGVIYILHILQITHYFSLSIFLNVVPNDISAPVAGIITNPNNIFFIYYKKSPLAPHPIFSCICIYFYACI